MRKIIVLTDGTEYPVVREDKKYLYCEGTQFRPNHPSIVEIKKVKEDEGFDKLPDIEEIEKDIEIEEKNIETEVKKAKKSSKKGEKK